MDRYGRAGALAGAVTIGFACGATAQIPTVIDCAGPFARAGNEAALVKAFGAANVKRSRIDIGEGMSEPGTSLFPRDPKRRIDILWYDKTRRRQPSHIMIREGSDWSIPVPGQPQARIKPGTTLAEVEAANSGPFTILGFGWDGGGHAGDWRGGRLGAHPAGCSVSMRFDHAQGADPAALDKISGDTEFASSDADMRVIKPFVGSITLEWPQP